MAQILSVGELRKRSGGDDDEGNQTAEREFLVKCDSRYLDVSTILADSRIPPRGAIYLNPVTGVANLFQTCRNRKAKQWTNKAEWWTVTVEYSTRTGTPPVTETTLIGTRPKVSYQTWTRTEAFTKDRDGEAVTNSANDAFDPLPETVIKENQFTVVAWFAQYDSQKYGPFKNSINEHEWLDGRFAAGTLRVEDISAEPQFQYNTEFYEVTFVLQENSAGWQKKILDQGYRKLKLVDAGPPEVFEQVNIQDEHGHDVTSPRLLDGSGQPATIPSTGTFVVFDEFAATDFADLGINNAPIL